MFYCRCLTGGTPSARAQCIFHAGNVARSQQNARLRIQPLGSALSHRYLIQKLSVLAHTHTHKHTHFHVYCNSFAKHHLRCASFCFALIPPPPPPSPPFCRVWPQRIPSQHALRRAQIYAATTLKFKISQVQASLQIPWLWPGSQMLLKDYNGQRAAICFSCSLGGGFGGGGGGGITAGRRNSQSHISETPYSHQRRQGCLISFLAVRCLATTNTFPTPTSNAQNDS